MSNQEGLFIRAGSNISNDEMDFVFTGDLFFLMKINRCEDNNKGTGFFLLVFFFKLSSYFASCSFL